MQERRICISFIIILLFLAGCHFHPSGGNTDDLPGLKSYEYTPYHKKKKTEDNSIRRTAVQETALSIGAQSGLAWRAKQINAELKDQAKKLDVTYNFQALLLDHNVLPPVLERGDNTFNLASPDAIRIADRTYKIEKQARFATTAPNWREYLCLNYEKPEPPHESLLPKSYAEQCIWNEYVERGWRQGIKQADIIFADNLARLTRDFKGMVLYRTLLAQRMVSPPFVAKTDLGVTGDANRININDQILRISALPALNPNSRTWKPALSEDVPPISRHPVEISK